MALTEYEKCFNDTCKLLAKICKESIELTEKQLDVKMSLEEKKLCLGLTVLYAFKKVLEKK